MSHLSVSRNRKSSLHRLENPRRVLRGRRVDLERLESRELLAAQPTAILTVPPRPMLGESMTFQVGFDNASTTDAGYGPFLDVVLPATGKDGNDGITFQSASYLGSSLSATVLTFDAAGHAVHPFAKTNTGAPVIVTGTPGDQLVVLQLPFGSFTPDQPTATVDVKAMVSPLADVDAALNVQATAGFSLGNDPLDNPTVDPSIFGPTVTSPASPALLKLTKTYLGPENETATGPSYHQQYLITVDVAAGQTVTNLDITDLLPANLQFVSVVQTAVHGVPTTTTAISTPSTTTPGGTLTRRFASVTGDASTTDATMLFEFYVPQNDASGNPVLTPDVGAPVTSVDQASSQADWTPVDPRDPAGTFTSNTDTHTLNDRSLAIQKSVQGVNPSGPNGTVAPGDTLEYTIVFQVSDFFAFQSLVVSDVISDGQTIRPDVHAHAPDQRQLVPPADRRLSLGQLHGDRQLHRRRASPRDARRDLDDRLQRLRRDRHPRPERPARGRDGVAHGRLRALPRRRPDHGDARLPDDDPEDVQRRPRARGRGRPGRHPQRQRDEHRRGAE